MATTAFINALSQLKYGDGASPEVFTTIYEVTRFSGVGTEYPEIEATHLQSTAHEFIGGLPTGKEFTFSINYNPTNATHIALLAKLGTTFNWKYVFPTLGGGAKTVSFTGLLKSVQEEEVTPDTAFVYTFTGRFSGTISTPV